MYPNETNAEKDEARSRSVDLVTDLPPNRQGSSSTVALSAARFPSTKPVTRGRLLIRKLHQKHKLIYAGETCVRGIQKNHDHGSLPKASTYNAEDICDDPAPCHQQRHNAAERNLNSFATSAREAPKTNHVQDGRTAMRRLYGKYKSQTLSERSPSPLRAVQDPTTQNQSQRSQRSNDSQGKALFSRPSVSEPRQGRLAIRSLMQRLNGKHQIPSLVQTTVDSAQAPKTESRRLEAENESLGQDSSNEMDDNHQTPLLPTRIPTFLSLIRKRTTANELEARSQTLIQDSRPTKRSRVEQKTLREAAANDRHNMLSKQKAGLLPTSAGDSTLSILFGSNDEVQPTSHRLHETSSAPSSPIPPIPQPPPAPLSPVRPLPQSPSAPSSPTPVLSPQLQSKGRARLEDIPVPRKRFVKETRVTQDTKEITRPAATGRGSQCINPLWPTYRSVIASNLIDGPRTLNDYSINVEEIVSDMSSKGFMPVFEVVKRILDAEMKEDGAEAVDIFSCVSSEIERWQLSLITEIAADIVALLYQVNYERTGFWVRNTIKSRDGVYVSLLRSNASSWEDPRNTPHPFDLFVDVTEENMVIASVYLDLKTQNVSHGVPVLVIGCYPRENEAYGFHRIGNLRIKFMTLEACFFISRSDSGLPKVVSFLMNDESIGKDSLVNDSKGKLINVRDVQSNSHALNSAISFSARLGQAGILNEQQKHVLSSSVNICHSWHTGNPYEKAQLQRILLVNGVPGCGKTHTAVYLITAILIYFNREFLLGGNIMCASGQIIVLTKTNKALDVFMERLGSVQVPNRMGTRDWELRSIPFFCKRSAAYLSRTDVENKFYKGQSQDPNSLKDVPVVLSTFGSLVSLYQAYLKGMGTAGEVCSWIAAYMKVLIIDEGSQSNLLDLAFFLYMFPFFNGVIVIFCDPNQMGPVVLTNVQQAKEFLTRQLFLEFKFALDVQAAHGIELSYQYRMNKEIMHLANDVAYGGRMIYGPNPRKHDYCEFPYRLGSHHLPFDPVTMYTTSWANSGLFRFDEYTNLDEIRLAEHIIHLAVSSGQVSSTDFVFLSPYKQQCHLMVDRCKEAGVFIPVHTVSSYQGEESRIVIYSLVRRRGSGTGFLHDVEMTNVAITRAIDRLIIIGDLDYLATAIEGTSLWKDVKD